MSQIFLSKCMLIDYQSIKKSTKMHTNGFFNPSIWLVSPILTDWQTVKIGPLVTLTGLVEISSSTSVFLTAPQSVKAISTTANFCQIMSNFPSKFPSKSCYFLALYGFIMKIFLATSICSIIWFYYEDLPCNFNLPH